MVRCARGECALMDARIDRFEIGGRKAPVALRDGAAAVEAVAGIDEPVRRAEIGAAAPGCAPFVAVPHQNCRQRLAPGDMVTARARPLAAAPPHNVAWPADTAQPRTTHTPH